MRPPDEQIRRRPGLNILFFGVIAVMAGHQGEHVAQMLQKDGAIERCPEDCRGLLGFIFDLEWIHFAYNTSILFVLGGLYAAYRLWRPEWRAAAPLSWAALTVGVFVVQGYHVVEHSVKMAQWSANGHKPPTPGLLGQLLGPADGRNFSLIELHFVFNSIVFVLVLVGYFGLGFHRPLSTGARSLAWVPAALVAVTLVGSGALAWAAQTPTVRLAAGEHRGPLVLDSAQKLIGERGTVVRGGIVVTADGVTIRDVAVVGGENGITIDGARGVVLDRVRVRGSELDGINVRRGSARIHDCVVEKLRSPYGQGIDISFSADREPTLVENCRIVGGQEAIATHWAAVNLRRNRISGTTLRGITVSEMSMGAVRGNHIQDAVGVGIFCGDYSHCVIEKNRVAGTRKDPSSDDRGRAGIGIYANFGATAEVDGNVLHGEGAPTAAFANGKFRPSR